jgi:hypothetical protein
MKTRSLRLFAWLAPAVLVSACTFQFNTSVEQSGAGQFRTEVGFNQADQEGLTTLGMSPEQFCEDMQTSEDLPVESPITVEERGDEVWCVVTVPFADLGELQQLYAGMQGVRVNELALTGDGFVYDVDVEFSETDTGEFGDVAVDLRWQVTMPGSITSHNAEEADGNTLTWNLALGQAANARATSEFGQLLPALPGTSGLGRTELILIGLFSLCCCGGLVAALGAGAFFLMRRNTTAPSPA